MCTVPALLTLIIHGSGFAASYDSEMTKDQVKLKVSLCRPEHELRPVEGTEF
jgi:hypothetical protein